jgi:GAF domain-containing protein
MTIENQHDEAHTFARIARELAGQRDLRATLDRIPRMARVISGCDFAALWMVNRQAQPIIQASTDSVLAEAHTHIIRAASASVDSDCLNSHSVVVASDVRVDKRWPQFSELLLRSAEPFLSLAAFPLGSDGPGGGALVLASKEAGYFSDDLIHLGSIFAEHAGVAAQSATAHDKSVNLQLAVDTNRRIGIALGIVMSTQRCTAEQAFDVLRTASQHNHLKLRDVAEEVIFTGAMPCLPVVHGEPTPALRSA